ncbi:type I DNA topoisomerase [Patescibacteria group bacterium]|nr:type I DNA topoisomerase [Patescibacteria group bacterium]
MKLVIVESPAKAKTIEKYLGRGYKVLASVGHVRDLPKSSKDAIDIAHDFRPKYVVTPGKSDVIDRIKKAALEADDVLLATDPDREGEAIAWHVAEVAKLKKAKRIVFNEITKDAVTSAVENPRPIDQNLRRAQEARRVLDRLVGYDLSGLIWKKVRYGLSAGRVQSPALRILCEREREIRAFVPEEFYTITGLFRTPDGVEISATASVEPKTRAEADSIVTLGTRGAWTLSAHERTPVSRAPRPPFTTSTLQQAASSRLGFSPSRTMRVAQKLYEQGLITYMRTDSTNLASVAVAALASFVTKTYGAEYHRARTYTTKSKNAQEAHEAVRPTDVFRTAAGSTEEEERLYALIHARTVASQMTDAELLRTKLVIETPDVVPFTTTGSVIKFDGWLAADPRARGEDVVLPEITVGDALTLESLAHEQKFTQPPARYTEAGLVKELEKRGIGRPSTYASIIKTLIDREYVLKDGRSLTPTPTGDVVSSFLEEHFASYISDSFTAEMENELDQIANGERDYAGTLREFYRPFHAEVESKANIEKLTTLGNAPAGFPCPLCGSTMVMKLGKNGVFMSCARFPECTGARRENGDEIREAEALGTHPDTGRPIYVRDGRFGPYVEMALEDQGAPTKRGGVKKPALRRASITAPLTPDTLTLADAVKLLSLPRDLGAHPTTGLPITAGIGKFGPFVVHDGDFRSLKGADDPYTVTLDRAMELFKEPKKTRAGVTLVREIGLHPKTKRKLYLYKSKAGFFLKKGFKRIPVPESEAGTLTPEGAATLLRS